MLHAWEWTRRRRVRYTHPMEIGLALWFLLALGVGVLASRGFGRSLVGWFLLAVVLTPLVGILLFLLPSRRPCPFCAELIQSSAIVCRYCGRDVTAAMGHPTLPALPTATRVLLLVLIVAVLAAALSQCEYRFQWWRSGAPIQVDGGRLASLSRSHL